MKYISNIVAICICAVLASCMGSDYADPQDKENPFGNSQIAETNVMNIADLKTSTDFKFVIANGAYKKVDKDIKIKGRVTGNDAQSNLYNMITIEDATGAIVVSVAQGGTSGFMPIGQEVLVALKGLYIGGYRKQAQIGAVYTSSNGSQSIGRMSRQEWGDHYKLIGSADASKVEPTVFDVSKMADESYLSENAGKLMTINGVELAAADGKAVFAPDDGSVELSNNCVNRAFKDMDANRIVLRTSTYAKFANAIMPTGKVSVTGIFTRFNNIWQILIRSTDDIVSDNPFEGIAGTGEGTAESPFNVTRALSMIEKSAYDATKEYYVSGIISSIKEVDTGSYGNANYYISDDGKDANTLNIFRGYYLEGAKFTSADQIKVGQTVVVAGKLTLYGTTPEMNVGNKLISIK